MTDGTGNPGDVMHFDVDRGEDVEKHLTGTTGFSFETGAVARVYTFRFDPVQDKYF